MTLRSDILKSGVLSAKPADQRRPAPASKSRFAVLVLFGALALLFTSCVSTPADQASENSESRFLQEQQLKGMPGAHN